MRIYKFKDSVDGHFAFILETKKKQATQQMSLLTSVPFTLYDSKNVSELKKPLVIRNEILPF